MDNSKLGLKEKMCDLSKIIGLKEKKKKDKISLIYFIV